MGLPTKTTPVTLLLAIALLLPGCSGGKSSPDVLENVEQMTSLREGNQQQETLALAKSQYIEVLESGARVRAAIEELHRLRAQWNEQVLPLLHNEDGHFLAAEKSAVVAFRAHLDTMPTVSQESIEQMNSELDALLEPVEAILKSRTIAGTPSPELVDRVADLDTRVQRILRPYKQTVSDLEALAADARRRGVRGTQSLQEEINSLIQADALTRASQLEAARKAAEDAVTKELAQAEQALILAQGEREREAILAEEARTRAEKEADALTARATNPDTLKRLEPFVTKGNTVLEVPRPFVYQWRQQRAESTPLSFGAISGHGALNPTEDGLEILHTIATTPDNDRPSWPASSSTGYWAWVKENQELLRELGSTLVSLGHLAP